MKRIFRPENFTLTPDGTEVSAFLNPTDTTRSDLPRDLLEGMSIAAGRIAPGARSWIHVHPAVTQVTYVVAGTLSVKMKDKRETQPYRLEVAAGSAIVSQPGTLLQLGNETEQLVEVLYVVSPSYVFEIGADAQVIHDDSILVAKDWNDLSPEDWDAFATDAAKRAARKRRIEALKRLTAANS